MLCFSWVVSVYPFQTYILRPEKVEIMWDVKYTVEPPGVFHWINETYTESMEGLIYRKGHHSKI